MPRPEHYNLYREMTEVVPGVFVTDQDDGSVYIVDDDGEVCMWAGTEFENDPTLMKVVVSAVALATKYGAAAVRKNIATKGYTLNRLINETKG